MTSHRSSTIRRFGSIGFHVGFDSIPANAWNFSSSNFEIRLRHHRSNDVWISYIPNWTDAEHFLDRTVSPDAYAARLSYYGNALVGNLRGHHGWEDRSYFPELSAADPRFDVGLQVLEKDHADLDLVLDQYTRTANRAIKLIHLDEAQARSEVGALRDTSEVIEAFLKRHLSDEEELAVPIILHHRLRG